MCYLECPVGLSQKRNMCTFQCLSKKKEFVGLRSEFELSRPKVVQMPPPHLQAFYLLFLLFFNVLVIHQCQPFYHIVYFYHKMFIFGLLFVSVEGGKMDSPSRGLTNRQTVVKRYK